MEIDYYYSKITEFNIDVEKKGYRKITSKGSWEKIDTYNKLLAIDKSALDKNMHTEIQMLSKDVGFEKEVIKLRKYFGLPSEGYTYDEVRSGNLFDRVLRRKIFKESWMRLSSQFELNPLLKGNVGWIVICNVVYLPITKILIDVPGIVGDFEFDELGIDISIMAPCSKNEFINYIDKNWHFIEDEMRYLKTADYHSLYISERDREIVDLRDEEDYKFKDIADLLAEKYDNFSINEDQIKTAYHRAKEKITLRGKR